MGSEEPRYYSTSEAMNRKFTTCKSCGVEKENNPTSDMPDGWTWELVGNIYKYEAQLNYLCDKCKEKE